MMFKSAVAMVELAGIAFTTSCSPGNKPRGADLTAVQIFDLRSKCAGLGDKISKEKTEGSDASIRVESPVSRYDPRTQRCYVELTTVLPNGGFVTVTDLYDGQTREILASASTKPVIDGKPVEYGFISGKAHSSHDEAQGFINHVMQDDRSQ